MGLLLVISAAAAARWHDKREQLAAERLCMHAVCTYTHSLGCQKGGLAKTELAGLVPLSQSCDKEILVHPPLTYTYPQWTGSSTGCRRG